MRIAIIGHLPHVMTLEAFIQDTASGFVEEAQIVESKRISADLVSVLPLIPHHYLGLRGGLYDPKVDLPNLSQESALKGSWAAMLLPKTRDTVLHSMLQARANYADDEYSRHVELLLPFLDEQMISRCMKKSFEPDMPKTAQHFGGILINLFRVSDAIMPIEKKLHLCTSWIRALKPEHISEDIRSITQRIDTILDKAKGAPAAGLQKLAQASLSAVSTISANPKTLESYRYDAAVSCVEKALVYGARSSKVPNSNTLLDRLIQRQKGIDQADSMATILSRWELSSDKKNHEANVMLKKIFENGQSSPREVLERTTVSDAIETIRNIRKFTAEDDTVKQISLWASSAYSFEKRREIRDVVSGKLASLLHPTSYEQYSRVYTKIDEILGAKFSLDLLMVMANPSWMTDTRTSYPIWYEMLERHEGNSVLLRAIVDAKIVPQDVFIKFIIENGHERWITAAGIQTEQFETLLLPVVEGRVKALIAQATADMQDPSGTVIPQSVHDVLSYDHASKKAYEHVKPLIATWFADLLSRDDLPPQQREKLDARYAYQIPISEHHMKTALQHRGIVPMKELRKRYIDTLAARGAAAELFDGYAQELFGDGVDARVSLLQGVFALPPENRNGIYIPKIRNILISWFRLLRLQDVAEAELANTLGRDGISIMKQLQFNAFWSDEILKNRSIHAVVPKKLIQKLLDISQKN